MTEKEKKFVEKVCLLRDTVVPSNERKLIERSRIDTRHGVVYTNSQYYYYKQL